MIIAFCACQLIHVESVSHGHFVSHQLGEYQADECDDDGEEDVGEDLELGQLALEHDRHLKEPDEDDRGVFTADDLLPPRVRAKILILDLFEQ